MSRSIQLVPNVNTKQMLVVWFKEMGIKVYECEYFDENLPVGKQHGQRACKLITLVEGENNI